MLIHPKVIATTLLGAVAIIVAAITQGTGDSATIGAAILTLVQAIVGYLTPGARVTPAGPPSTSGWTP